MMDLDKLLDAVEHDDNLENNYNIALFWFDWQQFAKAKKWAEKAMEHKENATPFCIEKLKYLIKEIANIEKGPEMPKIVK